MPPEGSATDARHTHLPLSLAAAVATPGQRLIAGCAAALLVLAWIVCVGLATRPAAQVDLGSALIIAQGMTAYLLGSQMVQQRQLSMMLTSLAFQFTGLMYNFVPLVIGRSSTAFFWISAFAWFGFAACFIIFALFRRSIDPYSPRRRYLMAMGFASPLFVLAACFALTFPLRVLMQSVPVSSVTNAVALAQAAAMVLALVAYVVSTRIQTLTHLWLAIGLLAATLNALLLVGSPDWGSVALWAATMFGLISCIVIPVVYIIEFNWLYARLAMMANALQIESRIDALTRVANRRSFDENLAAEVSFAARNRANLSLLIIDVDNFKNYNDGHGHQAGDATLRKVARALEACVDRGRDVVARYGGEEFAVILPQADAHGAIHVAEKIRLAIEALNIPHGRSAVSAYVTASIGVTTATPKHGEIDSDAFIRRADAALYRAKAAGKNRSMHMPMRDASRASIVS